MLLHSAMVFDVITQAKSESRLKELLRANDSRLLPGVLPFLALPAIFVHEVISLGGFLVFTEAFPFAIRLLAARTSTFVPSRKITSQVALLAIVSSIGWVVVGYSIL